MRTTSNIPIAPIPPSFKRAVHLEDLGIHIVLVGRSLSTTFYWRPTLALNASSVRRSTPFSIGYDILAILVGPS